MAQPVSALRANAAINVTQKLAHSEMPDPEELEVVDSSLRALSGPLIVDALAWYSDRLNLFQPAEPLFSDFHGISSTKYSIKYFRPDTNSVYALVSEPGGQDALVLVSETPQWNWHLIGYFDTPDLSLLDAKFGEFDSMRTDFSSSDAESDDYWGQYGEQAAESETAPDEKLTRVVSRFVMTKMSLYESIGASRDTFVEDMQSCSGTSVLGTYITHAVPEFIALLEENGYDKQAIIAALKQALITESKN